MSGMANLSIAPGAVRACAREPTRIGTRSKRTAKMVAPTPTPPCPIPGAPLPQRPHLASLLTPTRVWANSPRSAPALVPAELRRLGPQGHLLVSARFGGGQEEKFARAVAAALKAAGVDVYMVSATGGDDFGKQTMRGIARMSAMLAVCFDDYGAMTDSNYSSYYEVKAAYDQGKAIIPLRLSEKWPPVPPNDKDGDGADQNNFVFQQGLAYIDGRGKSAADCAALLLQQAGDKMPRSQ